VGATRVVGAGGDGGRDEGGGGLAGLAVLRREVRRGSAPMANEEGGRNL
jgi:hypothetical protein